MEYIEIEKELIPYRFDMSLGDEMFTFEVGYNPDYDFFTVDLEKNGELLTQGEKLVYGKPLFSEVTDGRFPSIPIIPYDESSRTDTVTWDTLSERVFLYLSPVEGGQDEH
ncbi:hypothetical protein J2Z69_003652 [Paenibacillus shirakamiensis]|uniref:Cyanophage baseplate Pam3 plug gp18 domain-containing protein n=1 Tax=Paenibacillus shirakamiensis TaxID=1265935 RepID=A0ABS4JLI6_9BACL|nr:hypothetical protein [Paenibacillus shirakamiensis]MBP2002566.1 hypothetical protein [Paenibacillus shirakamiensis]